MSIELKTALVTGASGAIGPLLVDALVRRGYRTRVLVRQPHEGLFPAEVEIVQGHLNDRRILREAVQGTDVVFHLAAKLHIPNPRDHEAMEYRAVNVEGTRALVDLAEAEKTLRLVYFSTIAVYGKGRRGVLFDEASEIGPDSWYSETKAEGEQIVISRIPGVILRLGAVYGGRMKGNYPRLVKALARGVFVPIGNGANYRTLVYESDVVHAALIAAEHPVAVGRIYNVTDGEIHTLKSVMHAICAALGRRPPVCYLPAPFARFAAGGLEDMCKLVGRRSPVGRATIDKLIEDIAVKGTKIKQDLGFVPQYDLIAGWVRAVAELRRVGLVN